MNLEMDVIAKYVERLMEMQIVSAAVESAIAAMAAGEFVLVVDDEDRENEGDLILAASTATSRADRVHGASHERPHLRTPRRRAA